MHHFTTQDRRAIVPLPNPDPSINIKNIQGDVYPTFPKKFEQFLFFKIRHPDHFRKSLSSFMELVSSAADVMSALDKIQEARIKNRDVPRPLPEECLVPAQLYQIGFSQAAFKHLNITGDIGDKDFSAGPQIVQAQALGDRPTGTGKQDVDWDPVWKLHNVHGVIVIAAGTLDACDQAVRRAKKKFHETIHIVNELKGHVRTGDNAGHEHFGFMDGLSQPAIKGWADPHPGQPQCNPGVIIMGGVDDPVANRPAWTKDGSVMAFRKLQQLVPEFDRFLLDHPINLPGLTPEEASALCGAKMIGRWKSGAPVEIAPKTDDEELAKNPDRNNDFDYSKDRQGLLCPFSAHIRKMTPRTTIPAKDGTPSLIVRAGIPYGEEVSDEEKALNSTIADRGLLFVAYQSTLDPGFKFLQHDWANNATFPKPNTGLDPLIGNQVTSNRERECTGQDPTQPAQTLTMPCDFVQATGGEYFFIPSISTLGKISKGEELGPAVAPPANAQSSDTTASPNTAVSASSNDASQSTEA